MIIYRGRERHARFEDIGWRAKKAAADGGVDDLGHAESSFIDAHKALLHHRLHSHHGTIHHCHLLTNDSHWEAKICLTVKLQETKFDVL